MASFRICSIVDCCKRHHARGFCRMHHTRLLRFGDPLGGATFLHAPLRWLHDHAGHDAGACLFWPFGSPETTDYGSVKVDGRKRRAHRVMCEIAHGPATQEAPWALHSCGMGHMGCVHPQHLYWGSAAQNKADTVQHGTHDRGERNWNSKLNEAAVRDIRQRFGKTSNDELSKLYGVSKATVINVAKRRGWAWLP